MIIKIEMLLLFISIFNVLFQLLKLSYHLTSETIKKFEISHKSLIVFWLCISYIFTIIFNGF